VERVLCRSRCCVMGLILAESILLLFPNKRDALASLGIYHMLNGSNVSYDGAIDSTCTLSGNLATLVHTGLVTYLELCKTTTAKECLMKFISV